MSKVGSGVATGAVTESVVTELAITELAAGGADAIPIEATAAETAVEAVVGATFPSHMSLNDGKVFVGAAVVDSMFWTKQS